MDQEVKGMINSEDWNYRAGVSRLKPGTTDTLAIGLYNRLLDNTWSYAISEIGVRFEIPDEVGVYRLRGGFSNRMGVTLYYSKTEFIALNGAIEIISIDKENSILEGRIDATYNNKNNINGYFTIGYCKD